MNEFDYNVDGFWTGNSYRFKGGGSSKGPSQSFPETDDTRAAKGMIYPLVSNAIEGRGFGTSAFNRQRNLRTRTGLQESFEQSKSEMDSQLNRSIRPEDSRVRNFVGASLDRSYITAKDQAERGIRAEQVSDQSMGMDMAGTMLANEQRLGVSSAQSFNNALAQNMATANTMGTYQSNIAAGVGQGLMDYNYAQQMSSQ